MKKQKVKVELDDWDCSCADGCCFNYGTTTTVNGVEMPLINQDTATILKMVLDYLGYDAEVIQTYNSEKL